MNDPRDVLGVTQDAGKVEIDRVFRMRAKELHPDVNPDPEAGEHFRALKAARDALIVGRATPPKKACSTRGMGSVFQRGTVWWVSIWHEGRKLRDSARTESKKVAVDLLNRCLAARTAGTLTSIAAVRDRTGPRSGLTLADLRDAIVRHASGQRLRSITRKDQPLKAMIRHLGETTPVEKIDKAAIDRYIDARLREPIGSARRRDKEGNLKCSRTIDPATVNREMTLLKQAFKLVGMTPPTIPLLKENDAREGFFEPGELERIIAELPERLRGWARLVGVSGWRAGEALGLRWESVDLARGTIRLKGSETKAARHKPKDRIIRFTDDPVAASVIREQRAAAVRWRREHGQDVEWVFWRATTKDEHGNPVATRIPRGGYSKYWNAASRRAGLPHKLVHDCRRTYARDGIFAGVDEKTIMDNAGWKSRDVFDRYSIRSEQDLARGNAKIAQYRAKLVAEAAQAREEEPKEREA